MNKHLQRVFAELLLKEATLPAGVLVTVARVDTRPSLQSAEVWLYVLPLSRGEDVLALLKNQLYELQGALNRELNTRPLPRVILRLDHGAAHADDINRRLKEVGSS